MNAQKKSAQLGEWTSSFGEEYTQRNMRTPDEIDADWERDFGVKKSTLFARFLSPERIPSGKVLEVGCNIGNQLQILRGVNPGLEAFGVEPGPFARAKSRELFPDLNVVSGTAFDVPFKDGFFDVVMTNVVLIHIQPNDLPTALAEIHRCSRRYIFLYEYFSETPVEVTYHGRQNLLWKRNFMEAYLSQFPDLRCVEVDYVHFQENGAALTDQVCLLEKVDAR